MLKKTIKKTIMYNDVDIEKFYICIYPEYESLNSKRFSYDIKKNSSEIIFNIKATDETALRTAESSISKLHTIYKKLEMINNGAPSRKTTTNSNS